MVPVLRARVSDPYPDPDPHGSALIWASGSGSAIRKNSGSGSGSALNQCGSETLLRAQGKPIYEINLKLKISCQTPFKLIIRAYGKNKVAKKIGGCFLYLFSCWEGDEGYRHERCSGSRGVTQRHQRTGGAENQNDKLIRNRLADPEDSHWRNQRTGGAEN
jgi:hypothetical protein